MNITIQSENQKLDVAYEDFKKLRIKIAELTGDEIGDHYKNMNVGVHLFGTSQSKFIDDYNKRIIELEKEFEIPSGILNFLYQPEFEGKIASVECAQIYEKIKDCKSTVIVFKNFKKIIKDCIDNNCDLTWE